MPVDFLYSIFGRFAPVIILALVGIVLAVLVFLPKFL